MINKELFHVPANSIIFTVKKQLTNLIKRIFEIERPSEFDTLALDIFRFQYTNNKLYRSFCNHLKIQVECIKQPEQIPFLPISFFKTRQVVSIDGPYEKTFTSSGTTSSINSRHFVKYNHIYQQSFLKAFELFYGNISEYCILALLPSYLERSGSSLVHMAEKLIGLSDCPKSGFYLNEFDKLNQVLLELERKGKKTILLGVTFALLDFAEKYSPVLKNTIIMETGGMKGKRKEMTREEVHDIFCKTFNTKSVHSEYGMTELLSQSYSKGNGNYFSPPWKKILIRDQYDPFTLVGNEVVGGINVIDLANIYSCSFIETMDLGKTYKDGRFEVLGRFDNSDIRGCNLMVG